jgi:hypothetical protein
MKRYALNKKTGKLSSSAKGKYVRVGDANGLVAILNAEREGIERDARLHIDDLKRRLKMAANDMAALRSNLLTLMGKTQELHRVSVDANSVFGEALSRVIKATK